MARSVTTNVTKTAGAASREEGIFLRESLQQERESSPFRPTLAAPGSSRVFMDSRSHFEMLIGWGSYTLSKEELCLRTVPAIKYNGIFAQFMTMRKKFLTRAKEIQRESNHAFFSDN